ncbi:MAG: hypothetical protein ACQETB_07980 [Halobacteriota archaeon]
MYETAYGTDWDRIDRESAIDRAFALGVATACGYSNEAELDRLLAAVDTAYDRSIVELAFREGLSKGTNTYRDTNSPEEVWESLIDGSVHSAADRLQMSEYLPGALGRIRILDREEGLPPALDLPSLLKKD